MDIRLGRSCAVFGLVVFVGIGLLAPGAAAQWVRFADETASRLSADPLFGADDPEEKDYAWGDVDQDGDVDLVVVRKEPFTSPGKRVNLLFINEAGAGELYFAGMESTRRDWTALAKVFQVDLFTLLFKQDDRPDLKTALGDLVRDRHQGSF